MAKRSTNPPTPDLHPSVSPDCYRMRVKLGWSPDRAASTPAKLRRSGSIVIDGLRTTVNEVRQRAGVSDATYQRRLRKGWSQARAARTPAGRSGRPDAKKQPSYEYRGKRMSLTLWSKHLGINYRTLLQRVNRGLSFAEAIEHKFDGRLPKKPR